MFYLQRPKCEMLLTCYCYSVLIVVSLPDSYFLIFNVYLPIYNIILHIFTCFNKIVFIQFLLSRNK